MPIVQKFVEKYGSEVPVLGYALMDETSQAIAGSSNWGVRLASVEDPDGIFRADLGISAPPTTLFVNGAGQIVHREYGAVKSLSELTALVIKYLSVKL